MSDIRIAIRPGIAAAIVAAAALLQDGNETAAAEAIAELRRVHGFEAVDQAMAAMHAIAMDREDGAR
jgi:hypothetical protein